MTDSLIHFIREQYGTNNVIPLHAPVFIGQERKYVMDTIDSTFVSSVGSYVDRFEHDIASYTGSPKAIAVVNGTAAIHVALKLAGVCSGDLVISQSMTFVATCNAIAYVNAEPVFIDVDRETLGLSPKALAIWLNDSAKMDSNGICRTKENDKIIRACVPMHTFGHPVDLDGLLAVCNEWNITIVEDAAESLGSFYKGRHTGTFGLLGAVSFNGNKILTTGGGGMILTNEILATQCRHLTTTAKKSHPYMYEHDEIGYNAKY
jgi:dTDP-4-amino-4,6-dideoxygalactose transaminase